MLLCNCTMTFIWNCIDYIVYFVINYTSNMRYILADMYLARKIYICCYKTMQNVMLTFIYYLLIRVLRNVCCCN